MTLRIVKSYDPIQVDQIIVTIYSAPGLGKTSLGSTSDSGLLLDFDDGAYRSANRCDSVPAKAWHDAANLTAADLGGYKTVIVDTAGRALDKLSLDIMERNPKMATKGGALTLQGFGALKSEFASWLKLVRSFGLDVVLLVHMDEQRNGDDLIERIDAQGGSKNEIYKCSDAMGRLVLRNGKRILLFSPTDTSFGKNPASLDPLSVPQFEAGNKFLGDVIRTIKTKLNEMGTEQHELAGLLGEWNKRICAATNERALNALIESVNALDSRIQENAKRLLWSFARDHDFDFEKGVGFRQKVTT